MMEKMVQMTKKMEPMRKKTRPPMGTTIRPLRSRKARRGVRAAELRVSPDAGMRGKGQAQQTTDSVVPAGLGKCERTAGKLNPQSAGGRPSKSLPPAGKLKDARRHAGMKMLAASRRRAEDAL